MTCKSVFLIVKNDKKILDRVIPEMMFKVDVTEKKNLAYFIFKAFTYIVPNANKTLTNSFAENFIILNNDCSELSAEILRDKPEPCSDERMPTTYVDASLIFIMDLEKMTIESNGQSFSIENYINSEFPVDTEAYHDLAYSPVISASVGPKIWILSKTSMVTYTQSLMSMRDLDDAISDVAGALLSAIHQGGSVVYLESIQICNQIIGKPIESGIQIDSKIALSLIDAFHAEKGHAALMVKSSFHDVALLQELVAKKVALKNNDSITLEYPLPKDIVASLQAVFSDIL